MNKLKNLYEIMKNKDIYKFFTYKYFINEDYDAKNPPLFLIDNNYRNHFNILLYSLLLQYISKNYKLKNIKNILSIENFNNFDKLKTLNYTYINLINKSVGNYYCYNLEQYYDNFILKKEKFTKKVDLLYCNNNYYDKYLKILNNDGILIIYNNNYKDFKNIINNLKNNFRSILFYKVLNSTDTYFIICYYYNDKYKMKNDIYDEFLKKLVNDYNIINKELNIIKNKPKKKIMYFYLNKLLKIIDNNQLQINPYYRKIFYYQRWKERIEIDSSKELQILEIGVYKGEMSIWFINNLLENKNSKIDLVDTWKGSVEYNEDFEKVYEEYKENIKYSKYPEKAIENRMTSLEFLAKHILKHKNPYYDLIYIDACHDSRCVMTDAMLSWKVLKLNGFLVFDDYGWNLLRDKPDYVRPKMSIDCFLNLFRDDIKIIHKGYKVFLKKIKEYEF